MTKQNHATDGNSDSTLPALQHWQLQFDHDQILFAALDRAGESVNALSREVLEEFERILDFVEQYPPKGLVLISAKNTGFIYGADVNDFDGFDEAAKVSQEIRRVHGMFRRLEVLPFPTVAAIEGFCLGGGLELALACRYRIAKNTSRTKLGFPEIQLGIFPGFGGSSRSVQRVGGLKAMELMLSAKQISASKAKAIGLVDQLIGRHESLTWAARKAILKGSQPKQPGLMARLSNAGPVRPFLAAQMRKQTRRKVNPEFYPAPFQLIDNWEQFGNYPYGMMQAEADGVGRLMVGSTAQSLRRVFHLMELLKSQGKQTEFKARHVHVIGAGVMGGDIAAWCALRGLSVSLQDREMKFINPAIKRAHALFRRKLRDPMQVKAAITRLQADPHGKLVSRSDVVIEAIFEDKDAKTALFQAIEPQLKPGAVLATNTSAIPLETLASGLKQPERLIGLHFFNPVAQMPLVEVVKGRKSSTDMLERGAAFCRQISRFPLPVKSSPGFLVNRVLAPYMMKALQMHREGTSAEALDAAAEKFGMPMGPVELADTVGLDVCLMVTDVLHQDNEVDKLIENPDRAFVEQHVKKGNLGKKTGKGFYTWHNGKPVKYPPNLSGYDLDSIGKSLMAAYYDECQAALQDGVVKNADLADAGMIFGTGFPPFRGGPLFYFSQAAAVSSNKEATEVAANV
jgi:3-hydroxyacyl-CoA dehydrogenase/enoyl-CoA hydratase/3-hydroxybutyryl-CoA epimerase